MELVPGRGGEVGHNKTMAILRNMWKKRFDMRPTRTRRLMRVQRQRSRCAGERREIEGAGEDRMDNYEFEGERTVTGRYG